MIAGAVCSALCGFLPVHFESYGLGEGAIVGDTPAEVSQKSVTLLGAGVISGGLSSLPTSGDLSISNPVPDQAVTASTTSAIQPYYPPNLGFSGSPQVTTLQPGEMVSRYGSTSGTFLSPAGTPPWARSLPPGQENLTLSTYEVVKPIENILSGTAASWWGNIGGGVQYYVGTPHGQNIKILLESGHLKPH